MTGTKTPDMKVGDAIVADLEALADRLAQRATGCGIEEYGASIAHQAPRPMGDHAGADDADHRIEPVPAIEAGGEQARDRQHRGQRIGQHMPVGRAQIVVLVVMGMMMMVIVFIMMIVVSVIMPMTMPVIMMVTCAQKP